MGFKCAFVNQGSFYGVLQASASHPSNPGSQPSQQAPLALTDLQKIMTTLPGVDRPRVGLWETIRKEGVAAVQNDVTIGGPCKDLKAAYEWRLANSRLPQNVIQEATKHLKIIVGLQSQHAEANSLYEYLSYQILYAIAFGGSRTLFDEMLQICSGPHSLKDLVGLIRGSNLRLQFKFVSTDLGNESLPVSRAIIRLDAMNWPDFVKDTLSNFIKTLEHIKLRSSELAILDSPAYELGYDYLIDIFAKALSNPKQRELVERAVMFCAMNPLPLLTMNRVFHLLQSRHYYRKIPEFFALSWGQIAPQQLSHNGTEEGLSPYGTVEGGFVKHPVLEEIIQDLVRFQTDNNDNAMRHLYVRWREKVAAWRKKALRENTPLDKYVIADFLSDHQYPRILSKYTEDLAEQLRQDRIELIFLTRAEMLEFLEWRYEGEQGNNVVSASFLLPEQLTEYKKWLAKRNKVPFTKNQNNPSGIVLLKPPFTDDDEDNAYSMMEAVSATLHEYVHLMQLEQYGIDFVDNHTLLAEMLAFGVDILFQSVIGDRHFYQYIAQYSPISFGIAFRNCNEQRYHRKMPPPK